MEPREILLLPRGIYGFSRNRDRGFPWDLPGHPSIASVKVREVRFSFILEPTDPLQLFLHPLHANPIQ